MGILSVDDENCIRQFPYQCDLGCCEIYQGENVRNKELMIDVFSEINKMKCFFFAKIKRQIKRCLGAYYSWKANCSVDKGEFVDLTYGQMFFIKDYSIDKFISIKKYNDEMLTSKIRSHNRVKFAFVTYTSSMWNLNYLHQLLCEDCRYDVDVVVGRFSIKDESAREKEYNETIKYFKDLKYSIIEAENIKDISEYDVLFYLTPFAFFDDNINLKNVPTNVLLLHASYSYMLAGNMRKLEIPLYHLVYRYYTDTDFYQKMISKLKFYTGNAVYLGFPKMDYFYQAQCQKRSTKKIIIYAPHHSVNYTKFKAATFEDNHNEILELAKEYIDTTYWIYKPHPLLRAHSVEAGIFSSVDEYDIYEEKWRQLQNAEVISAGEYFSIFKESDAMITDSVSFLAEYQFTHNPLLLLKSEKEEYNNFGQSLIDILYQCLGTDIGRIESFVKNIIASNDEDKGKRMAYFEKNLSYIQNGKLANERIYEDILSFSQVNR